MQENIISAEVQPSLNRTTQAASALQRLGFRILHTGTTISVQGPEELWTSVFNVSFETRKKTVLPGVEKTEMTYRKALTETLEIPTDLQPLISGVMFVEPPEFH